MNWPQLQTILWLRWHLTRHQWTRSGGLGAVVALLIAVGAAGLGVVTLAGGFLGGFIGLREASPLLVLGVWFGITVAFLFFWMIGLMMELQRSETIDLQRLMHLPVALGQIFVINYLASHLALSIVIVVPAMLGLAVGLATSRGAAMLLLAPLALSLVFMVTAWTYCLRGWLASMMTNPRRRRAVIMGISLAFILVAQGPNLYFNVLSRQNPTPAPPAATLEQAQRQVEDRESAGRATLQRLIEAQEFIPLLWLPAGAHALAENRPLPALLGTLGSFVIGALGLRRAYRGTVRFYQGGSSAKAAAPAAPVRTPGATAAAALAGSRFLERRLPGVPEQAAALALATMRSLLRAPEVKMAWATSFIVTIIAGATIFFQAALKPPEAVKPFLATGSAAFSLFILFQFLANQFGFDRDGFRALVLCPAERRLILLGKNLASLPVAATFGLVLLGATSVRLDLPPDAVVAAVFQLVIMLVLTGLGGNLLSLFTPYRIQAGSMKPTKMPAAAMIAMMLCQLLFPVALTPAFLPPLAEWLWQMAEMPRAVPVNLLLSMALAALAVFAYWRSLESLGRVLQRRETKILDIVTAGVE